NRLSGGDKRVLIRLQNKYRSIIAREPDYVREIIRELEEEGKVSFNPYTRMRIRGISSNVYKNHTNNPTNHASNYPSQYGNKYYTPMDNDSNGQLLDLMGQFISNMKSINISSLTDLIIGLRDLSNLAVANKSGVDYMNSYDWKIRDLSNEVTLLNAAMNREREQVSRLGSQHKALAKACKGFLSLSDTDKLAHLNDFVAELQACTADR
ncbi:MAG TPA: hypothetical protein VFD33_06700, partial [Bacillota bacterium]|nr:hypothetical protein [Bacillota bacterium]